MQGEKEEGQEEKDIIVLFASLQRATVALEVFVALNNLSLAKSSANAIKDYLNVILKRIYDKEEKLQGNKNSDAQNATEQPGHKA